MKLFLVVMQDEERHEMAQRDFSSLMKMLRCNYSIEFQNRIKAIILL